MFKICAKWLLTFMPAYGILIIVNKKGLDKNEKQNVQSVWQCNNSYVHYVCYVDSCELGKHQSA